MKSWQGPHCHQPAGSENTSKSPTVALTQYTPFSQPWSPEKLSTCSRCLLPQLIHFKMGLISPSWKMFDFKGGNIFTQVFFGKRNYFWERAAFPPWFRGSGHPHRAFFSVSRTLCARLFLLGLSPPHTPHLFVWLIPSYLLKLSQRNIFVTLSITFWPLR